MVKTQPRLRRSSPFETKVANHLMRRYRIEYPPQLTDTVSEFSFLVTVLYEHCPTLVPHFERFLSRVGITLEPVN